jgi:peptidoglycan/xylan/chitin deacetylase (PgdA/CDA1 family)
VSAIFTYHSIDESGSVISTSPETFRRQMEALAASGAKAVPLRDIGAHPEAVAITFDDGFGNFADHALPVLERLSLPASVFVVSGYSGKRNNWPGQQPECPELPLLSWSALRDLPPAISLGAHSITHPDLRALNDAELLHEVRGSRLEVEQATGRAVSTFAYPYGAVDRRSAAVVRSEFTIACGTRLRYVGADADRAVLPRLDVYYLKSPTWFARPFGLSTKTYIGFRRCLREARLRYSNIRGTTM